MSSIFGGRDPFDDPFFTRPFGSFVGSNSAHDQLNANESRGPIIEELDSDYEQILDDSDHITGDGESGDKDAENAWANRNPLVEHPEDQTDDRNESKSKEISSSNNHCKVGGKEPHTQGATFQRVTYGGINGAYYTASTTRRTGSDGVVLEESKQADRTTGQATHRISRGILDKGHSFTRKLNADGKVDTVQTLHNLDEDELASFEQTWKGNADSHLPGWDDRHNFHSNSGNSNNGLTTWSGWPLSFGGHFGRDSGFRGFRPNSDPQAHSAGGRPKKVVTIPIE